ncbi:MAG: NAD(P)-binding protein [Candidatus Hodarchaeales archaeon]|jgi:flavin-dependent dehydrogenase
MPLKQHFTIVGGNISGLSAAYYLSKKGYQVSIYESKIWNKPCGGAISVEFNQYLREELDIELEESDHFVPRFKVGLWNGRHIEDEGIFTVTTRYDLQNRLIRRLQEENNVEIIQRRILSTDTDLFTTQTVVATGYSGFSKQIMEREWEFNNRALTLRFDGKIPKCSYPNAHLIVLDPSKMGYGWVFIGKDNHLNIGVGGLASNDELKQRYIGFFRMLKANYGYNINLPQQKPQSWVLPLPVNKSKYSVSTMRDGIEFIGVGDVLGLAHSLSGAGIEPAWQSGWVLAECVDSTRNCINTEKYQRLLVKNLRLSSWRRLDHFFSTLSRKRFPFKDKIGYLALQVIRHRILKMMRRYPWFALVHDESKPTGFTLPTANH